MKIVTFVNEVTEEEGWQTLPGGRRHFTARTLRDIVDEIGGYEGTLMLPDVGKCFPYWLQDAGLAARVEGSRSDQTFFQVGWEEHD